MNKDKSEDPSKFKAKSVSTENSSNYNASWTQNGYVISPMNTIPVDRWPFKLRDETDEEFDARMEKLKNNDKK